MGTIIDYYSANLMSEVPDSLPEDNGVDHPDYYGGKDNPYEAIKVIEAWDLGFNLGNVVKYVSRAGKKYVGHNLEDLEKARWYLDREISKLKDAGFRSK